MLIIYVCILIIGFYMSIIVLMGETSIQVFSKAKLFFLYKNHKNFIYIKNVKDNVAEYIYASLVSTYIIHAIINQILIYIFITLDLPLIYIGMLFTIFNILLEIITKKIAISQPEKTILKIGFVYIIICKFFKIISLFINKLVSIIMNKFFLFEESKISEDEDLLSIVELKIEKDNLSGGMIKNILHIKNIYVEDIMTPKNNIIYVNFNKKTQKMAEDIKNFTEEDLKAYIPIWNENSHNFIGIINTQKLFLCMINNNINYNAIMEEMFFLPSGTNIYKAISLFKKKFIKFTFVVNEYGEIIGILTLRDLLEEIVGDEIFKEIEDEEVNGKNYMTYNKSNNNNILILDGDLSLKELNKYYNIDFFSKDTYSINDLILQELKTIPEEGTEIVFQNLSFIILDSENNKILKVLASLKEKKIEN
jgi:Mg2+/Co2+ transporter CorB